LAFSLQTIRIINQQKNKMKKLFVTMFVLGVITTSTQAQDLKATPTQPQKKEYSKVEKEAMKAKKESDLVEAFKKADLNDEQQKNVRETLDASNEKSKAIKSDSKLSEDEKKAKLDEVYKERNEKLKEIMGEMKHKAYKQAQKAQKEAAATMQATIAPVKE
jgi:hypothetical protein